MTPLYPLPFHTLLTNIPGTFSSADISVTLTSTVHISLAALARSPKVVLPNTVESMIPVSTMCTQSPSTSS